MPALTPEHQEKMLGYQNHNCSGCGQEIYKDYCRQCDDFLYICSPNCSQNNTEHEGHRRYPKKGSTLKEMVFGIIKKFDGIGMPEIEHELRCLTGEYSRSTFDVRDIVHELCGERLIINDVYIYRENKAIRVE